MASSISTVQQVIAQDPYATFSNFDRDSPRIWTIPIVEGWDVGGRTEVRVVGFAQFFIENIKKKNGNTEIIGRFVRFVTNGEISDTQTDYGTYGVKMIPDPETY